MNLKEYAEKELTGYQISDKYSLGEIIGHGKIGVVFRGTRKLTTAENETVAIKIIPSEKLRKNWEDEIVKLSKIKGNVRVPRYIDHGTFHKQNKLLAYIVYEFISSTNLQPSPNLHEWLNKYKPNIPFLEGMILEVLEVFHAMKVVDLQHNDLHSGNILVNRSEQEIESEKDHFYVTDFGIGGSANDLTPKDDFLSLAEIINTVLEKIDFPELTSRDREKYDRIKIFLKDLTEKDPTVDSYVLNPKQLRERLKSLLTNVDIASESREESLSDPFEYLSCEQIGNSFKLLTQLYSSDFLGRNDLLERNNTIFTGPRGCGKTTVFRNLSTKISFLTGRADDKDFVGVYYQCMDLFYAFPYLYLHGELEERGLKVTASYLNLALFYELLETLSIIRTHSSQISMEELLTTIEKIKLLLPTLRMATTFKSDPLDTTLTWVEDMKRNLRRQKLMGNEPFLIEGLGNLDFLKNVCAILQNNIGYFNNKPIYFFIDDYSHPKIPNNLQKSLNLIIFQRNAECFFKVSTESITSICPEDASGKILELSREYDVIDLGSYFLNADPPVKMEFMTAIVNNRLNLCPAIDYKEIQHILGSNNISDIELALRLRKLRKSGLNGKGKKRIKYHGIEVFVDLCSGEIGLMLRMLKEMFVAAKKKRNWNRKN